MNSSKKKYGAIILCIATAKDKRILIIIRGSAFTPVPRIDAKLNVPPVKMIPQFKNCLLE